MAVVVLLLLFCCCLCCGIDVVVFYIILLLLLFCESVRDFGETPIKKDNKLIGSAIQLGLTWTNLITFSMNYCLLSRTNMTCLLKFHRNDDEKNIL